MAIRLSSRRSEKATLAEILNFDSISQISKPNEGETVSLRVSMPVLLRARKKKILAGRIGHIIGPVRLSQIKARTITPF